VDKQEYTLEQTAVHTLRVLAGEAISNANSGHTGIALGAAPAMYSIYNNLKFDPRDGAWFNRDRFVMSAGHGSALLYATLKCMGVPHIDLRTFRKFGSEMTGHPEVCDKLCVDCSTGPLGQGIATAVGIALAEKKLANKYNVKGDETPIIDHYTFCLVGDGCLMEGASYEACSLAGLWKLNKLIVVYDANEVTLDGKRGNSDIEDVTVRFIAQGWNVTNVKNGGDEYTISTRIRSAMKSKEKPTLIITHTNIGHGSKHQGSHKAHGSVLSIGELSEMRKQWGIVSDTFEIDDDIKAHFAELEKKKIAKHRKWKKAFKQYATDHPKLHAELLEFIKKPYKNLTCKAGGKKASGRDSGYDMLNQLAGQQPRIFGGSADVASTTKTYVTDAKGELTYFTAGNPKGDNIAYGVREFAMAAISNGLALHGFQPYCSTFLAFSDYCKPAMRMTALMNLPVTYIFTHDGLGNPPDGPTHQATEHIAALRLVPNMAVYRPADDVECAAVFEYVFEQQKPACILLSRGDLASPSGANKKNKQPRAVLLSSGSEVNLCVRAQTLLGALGVFVNVVSVPCLEQLDPKTLDRNVPHIAVELGNGTPWWALFGKLGLHGGVISFDKFGACGKDADVMEHLGFTPEKIADRVLEIIKK